MKWNPDLGTWSLVDRKHFKIDGTTPTNADQWSLTVEVGELLVSVGFDFKIWYVHLVVWAGKKVREVQFGKHRNHAKYPMFNLNCPCQQKGKPTPQEKKS